MHLACAVAAAAQSLQSSCVVRSHLYHSANPRLILDVTCGFAVVAGVAGVAGTAAAAAAGVVVVAERPGLTAQDGTVDHQEGS